jgi:hypothetical protein
MNVPEFGSVPLTYSPGWFSQMTQRLRTTFNQLNTFQPILAASILADANKFPTDANYADLRSGEFYVDTTAGNVLKMKP